MIKWWYAVPINQINSDACGKHYTHSSNSYAAAAAARSLSLPVYPFSVTVWICRILTQVLIVHVAYSKIEHKPTKP